MIDERTAGEVVFPGAAIGPLVPFDVTVSERKHAAEAMKTGWDVDEYIGGHVQPEGGGADAGGVDVNEQEAVHGIIRAEFARLVVKAVASIEVGCERPDNALPRRADEIIQGIAALLKNPHAAGQGQSVGIPAVQKLSDPQVGRAAQVNVFQWNSQTLKVSAKESNIVCASARGFCER